MKTFSLGVSTVLILLSLTTGAWASPTHPDTQYVEGDAIVTFKSSITLTNAQQVLAGHALVWKQHFAGLSRHRGKETGLVHAQNRTTAQLIAELKNDPNVETAEPNYLRWVATTPPNDTYFTNLWALQNTGQSINGLAGTAGDDIRFIPAWALAQQPGTNPPVVAVIDTGVDYRHPDLASNIWINTAENPTNGLDNDGDGYINDYYGYDFADNLPDPIDSGFHGTHVAGTVAAVGNNNLGVIGVCYQARIMALRASSDGNSLPDSAVIEAIQYATMMKGRGVNVVAINESFGGGGSSSSEIDAMQAAGTAGIIFCCAAGNNSSDNDTTPFYPASYRLGNMIVVAATDQNDALASFSDYGTNTVDLGAPGVNILSLLPIAPGIPPEGTVIASVQQGSTVYNANELTYSGISTGLTATVYACGLGNPTDFPAAVRSNIALIERGTLTFSNKVINAMAAGAAAAIIYNNAAGNFLGTLGGTNNWIPAVSLAQADGLALQTNAPATVVHGLYQYLDGTSMATPHVSGAVAFAAMNFPTETVTQRVERVLTNADVIADLQGLVHNSRRLNLQRMVDTDGNGLPDWWELEYFGHLTGTDPNADPDHDGMSNLAEWIAGTNPTNAVSCLRASVLSVTNASGVVVGWSSVTGKLYWLARSTNLLTGFSTISTNITATAPTNILTDTTALPGGTYFYRVGVEQ
ncbi:MAG: S8 family serine peptidase [Verrucomicrobiota bacterium]|jgi:subtilisin family serine protease